MIEKDLINGLSENCPNIYKRMNSYYVYSDYELIIKFEDGFIYSYDNFDKNYRNIFNPELENEIDQAFEFGYRLYKLIKRNGYTQKEFADEVGLYEYQISKYILGKTIPNFRHVIKIAKVLNCHIDELVYNVPDEKEFKNV